VDELTMTVFEQRPIHHPDDRRRAGISMVEVMIALTILGFGMLTMAAAQISALHYTGESRNRSEAHNLAQQQMEAFQGMTGTALDAAIVAVGYPNDPANPLDPDPLDAHVSAFNRSWLITPDTPEAGVYTINVQVNWTDQLGRLRIVEIEGLKAAF
jgi:type II secretory pathway pseudopilin PulG